MTTPTEFVLWLNGAAGVMGEAPTPEQWEAIKEKMNESLGFLAAKKLLERAEDQIVRDREHEVKMRLQPAYSKTHLGAGQPSLGGSALSAMAVLTV